MPNQHVGISSVSIRNFRGIESLDLSFLQPNGYPTQVVVLGGPNGSGKTSVLEACLIATGNEAVVRGSTKKGAIRQGATGFRVEVTCQHQGRTWARWNTSENFGGSPFDPSIVYFSSWRTPKLVGALGVTAGKRGKVLPRNEQNRLLNIKQYLVNARAHELFPKSMDGGGSRYEAVLNALNRVWKLFFPGQTFRVEPVGDDPDDGFDVFISEGGRRLAIDSLSSGQLEIFMFAGGVAIEELQRGIIIIDEPELHLDPQWHRPFLRALLLLKPECQLIVGTHSPEIFDSVKSFERHFLVPENDPRAQAWTHAVTQEVAT